MVGTFINKVEQIILIHIEDENFGVIELASEVGLSRSQLLRKVKSLTGKTVNEFIKETRLKEALKLLKETDYTASEISFMVGFSSPAYFNTCFHSFYGYPPGEVKLRETLEVVEEIQAPEQNKDFEIQNKKALPNKKVFLISLLAVLLFISISYIIYSDVIENGKTKTSEATIDDKSIAVLPFINFSDDKENQYFADGVMDDILTRLSAIKEFRVISRTTMEQYRETNKTAPEIAKELNVSYIIESSIQKYKDSIRVTTQLIDAGNDKHIWSKVFDKKFKNIFALESEIAKQIAEELKTTLSFEELKQIDKIPTKNLEAYELYLKGRFFWHQRTKEDSDKGIYYFKKAIELDSTFALAYTGLSDTYFTMANWGWYPKNDGFNKSKEFAKKAIFINQNIAEAHATVGRLLAFKERKWEEAEKELKLAISLNPNSVTARLYYYEILDAQCRNFEARKQIDYAIELNPHSCGMYNVSAGCYFRNSNFIKSLEESKKGLELAEEQVIILHLRLKVILNYLNLNRNREAIENIKILTSSDQTNSELIDNIYQTSGIEGVLYWFADWMLLNQMGSINRNVAKIYAIIGDSETTLKYLEKGFEDNEAGIHWINCYPNFDFVKDDPRFVALIDKMNLAE